MIEAIRWDGRLHLIDQRELPHRENWLSFGDLDAVAEAIRAMVVRGAPAIAIAGAYGLVLGEWAGIPRNEGARRLLEARPTAVNLRWAMERMAAADDLEAEARAIHAEDIEINRALGRHGAPLLKGGVLTICNTGSLATGGYGTALGMIRAAHAAGTLRRAYALETRPYLQGARLTAWECAREEIPCTLLTDGMAGALMAEGGVDVVVVGCDRVATNGDTANKVGTYALAVLARFHDIPFYVAMPTSTLDRRCPNGSAIPIERRDPAEVRGFRSERTAPEQVEVYNPAFDVTPARLVAGWVCEHGVWKPPFRPSAEFVQS